MENKPCRLHRSENDKDEGDRENRELRKSTQKGEDRNLIRDKRRKEWAFGRVGEMNNGLRVRL